MESEEYRGGRQMPQGRGPNQGSVVCNEKNYEVRNINLFDDC